MLTEREGYYQWLVESQSRLKANLHRAKAETSAKNCFNVCPLLPPATKLGQGYVFTGVCHSVNRGVCLSACWDTTIPPGPGTPPQDQAPPRRPPKEETPLVQSMLGDMVNGLAVCILLEYNLIL